eukprot:TRINITY_DN1928_c0_g4_i1.p1 TRINITY_DN1928_c0_g4~~TRINITY_DN1928_c0_g4_i1.p1  ORF type:complete len:377 (+),score=57.09 TRINITY_DN1928_c0_g4_i1:148-1278(+)
MYFVNKGLVLEKLNRLNEANKSYQTALKLNPNEEDAKNQLSALNYSNKSGFSKELSEEDQNEIAEQFLIKLCSDKAFQWVGKLATIQTYNMKEVCSYYSYILPFIISSEEASNIQIQQYNVKIEDFKNIHYGIFREEMIIVKEQEFNLSDDNNYFISMLREISILLYCDHPNICKIIGVHFNPKSLKLLIVQEKYFTDLFEVLEDKQVIQKKKDLIIQLLEALIYIHSLGLILQGLTPQNIVFKTQKLANLLLLDFGIPKLQKQNIKMEDQTLNYFYSSPEASKMTKQIVTPQSDIFSFGIVLYELATGYRTWKNYIGKGQIAIYNLIQSNFDFFQENQTTGNFHLDRLILDCVQQDPNKRPSAKDCLQGIKSIQF